MPVYALASTVPTVPLAPKRGSLTLSQAQNRRYEPSVGVLTCPNPEMCTANALVGSRGFDPIAIAVGWTGTDTSGWLSGTLLPFFFWRNQPPWMQASS